MAWKKANTHQPANGTPRLVGEPGEQRWIDVDGDTLYATSPDDYPKAVTQTNFLGTSSAAPAEGSTHSLLVKIASDVAAIKSHLKV